MLLHPAAKPCVVRVCDAQITQIMLKLRGSTPKTYCYYVTERGGEAAILVNPDPCISPAQELERMPCPQRARSAKFCMAANTQILVLALFHKFVVP